MEYNLALKKKKILPFATAWMDLENIMLSEISQSEKHKYQYGVTHMWNLMNKIETEAQLHGTDRQLLGGGDGLDERR